MHMYLINNYFLTVIFEPLNKNIWIWIVEIWKIKQALAAASLAIY